MPYTSSLYLSICQLILLSCTYQTGNIIKKSLSICLSANINTFCTYQTGNKEESLSAHMCQQFGTQHAEPTEMKVGVKIPSDMKVMCMYSMGNTSC